MALNFAILEATKSSLIQKCIKCEQKTRIFGCCCNGGNLELDSIYFYVLLFGCCLLLQDEDDLDLGDEEDEEDSEEEDHGIGNEDDEEEILIEDGHGRDGEGGRVIEFFDKDGKIHFLEDGNKKDGDRGSEG